MSVAAGFVLAGGQSTRMGRDKALLDFGGRPLIVHACSTLKEAGFSASIAGANSDLSSYGPVILDPAPGMGPLSGICSALASSPSDYAVFLPVDLPLLPATLLSALLWQASKSGATVTLASVAGFAQTFPAVLRCSALTTLQAELDSGRGGCFSAFEAAAAAAGQPVRVLPAEYLVQAGQLTHAFCLPVFQWFLNANTPNELERVRALSGIGIA